MPHIRADDKEVYVRNLGDIPDIFDEFDRQEQAHRNFCCFSGLMKISVLSTVTIIGVVTWILNFVNGSMCVFWCSRDNITTNFLLSQPMKWPRFTYGWWICERKARFKSYSPYRLQASFHTISILSSMKLICRPKKSGAFQDRSGFYWHSCTYWPLFGTVSLRASARTYTSSTLD